MRQLLMIFFLLTGLAGLGQNVVWEWAKQIGTPDNDFCNGLSVSLFGNIQITGFSNFETIAFDSILLNPNYYYIAEYSNNGIIHWAKSTHGSGFAEGQAIVSDNIGNIYASGRFIDTVIFDLDTISDEYGLFLAKYHSTGEMFWTKKIVGEGLRTNTLKNDLMGNVYFGGYFSKQPLIIENNVLSNSNNDGSFDGFITKFDSTGNALWARSIGGLHNDEILMLSPDFSGNVLATGYFTSASITIDTITLINHGNYDVFLVKYDGESNVKWAKGIGGPGTENPNSMFTDQFGNAYIGGYYTSPALNLGEQILNNPGYSTAFLAKFNPEGNLLWAKNIGEGGMVDNVKITSDRQTRIFISGYLLSDLIHFGTTGISGIHSNFVAQMDFNGNFSWATSNFSNSEILITTDIQYCPDNSLIIGGNFTDSLIFGSDTLFNFNQPGSWDRDIFLAKLHIEPTGFEEVPLLGTLQVYPNPATGLFNVVVPGGTSLLRVYDCFGRLLQQYPNSAQGEMSILVSNSGLFLIQAINQKGVLNARVVVR
jgi:hypothetical protein